MAIGLNRQGAAMLLLQAWLISYLFGIGCVIVAGNFGPYFLIDARHCAGFRIYGAWLKPPPR